MVAQSARGGQREKWGELPMSEAPAPLCDGHPEQNHRNKSWHARAGVASPWNEEVRR
jgi:hypothetical protein